MLAWQVPPRTDMDGQCIIAGRALDRRTWIAMTPLFNLTGQPAATVPCGFSTEGLPIGLQIVGPAHADARVLAAARAFENARPFARIDTART